MHPFEIFDNVSVIRGFADFWYTEQINQFIFCK